MAAVDFVELAIEESPVYEGAATGATPYRIATDKLYLPARSAQLLPGPQHLDRSDELRGIQGAPARLIEGFDVSGSLSVRGYPQALTWLLTLAGFKATYTAGNGVITDPDTVAIPTGAHRWVFQKRDAIDAKTCQARINYATENVLITGNGVALSSLQMSAAGDIAADLMGLVFARAAADTTTVPTPVATTIPPFRRRELVLSWLSGSGRTQDFSWQISNPLQAIRSLGLTTPSAFADAMEFGDDQVYVSGSIPKRILTSTDLQSLLDASTFSAKAKWKSQTNIGATGYPFQMWVEMPACQHVSGSPSAMGNKRRFGLDSLDFFAAYDSVSGYDVKVTLVNDVSSIAAAHGAL